MRRTLAGFPMAGLLLSGALAASFMPASAQATPAAAHAATTHTAAHATAVSTAAKATSGKHQGSADAPYLGWSSWSLQAARDTTLNPDGDYSWLTEDNVLKQVDVMASKLKKHGYTYINVDAGWWREWDWTPEYDSHGRYAVDKDRFPHGIAWLARYVHRKGLKLGLYVPAGMEKGAYDNGDFPIAGSRTGCTTHDAVYDDLRTTNGWDSSYALDFDKPCAQQWVDSIADEMAGWGVDFLKIDGVGYGSGRSADSETVAGQYDNRAELAGWNKAFKKTGRDVKIQLSWALDHDYVSDWQKLADSWRIDWDVECYCSTLTRWNSVKGRFTDVLDWIDDAGHGKGWNNLDSLDVGNGDMDGLSDDERQTTTTLWAIEAAPLYSGDDLTQLDAEGLKLLTNDEVLAVDQAGVPAAPVDTSTDQQVWTAKVGDHYVVALFNLSDDAATVSTDFSDDLGVKGSARIRDLWQHQNLGRATSYSATVPAHGSVLLTVTPSRGAGR
ncbi:MAG: glycoside hydrolase family 27 protein [Nocardioides sp.]|uniref:glycoside hydrolase family 27 protein n=1 Tax=Nocardioides sp. TaxID=35761 RepID=UPI0039E29DF7